MAREYAPVRVAIWADDDFRDLSPMAQHLYFVLVTSPALSHAGVTNWFPNRIAALARGWTAGSVEQAGRELEDRLYVVIDQATGEILIRSFIRHDGLMKQPKMAVSMANSHAAIASSVLRGVIVHELRRLKDEHPELNGWSAEKASELLSKRSLDPSTYPSRSGPDNPPPNGSASGSVSPKATPKPEGSVSGSPSPAPKASSYNYNSQPGAIAAARDLASDAGCLLGQWCEIRQQSRHTPSKKLKGEVSGYILEALESYDYAFVEEAVKRSAKAGFSRIDVEIGKMTSPPPGQRQSASNAAVHQALGLLHPEDQPMPRAIGA